MRNAHSVMKSVGVALQVRVVVTVNACPVELINGVASGSAEKQLLNRTVHDCAYRGALRSTDVDCFVTKPVAHFIEAVA